jgi:putative membrane protein
MGADNLDIFRKVVFNIPPLKYQVPAIIILGLLYSLGMLSAFRAFTSISPSFTVAPLVAFFVFILPTILSAEVFYQVLPDYPRKWGYFLALSNQLFVFIYTLILSGADNVQNAWSIIWLGLITVYLVNLLVLVMSVGISHLRKISVISLVHPLTILAAFHFFLGRFLDISARTYFINFGSVLIAAFFLITVLYVIEYLIRSNADVTVFQLTSSLLKKERSALDIGIESRADVQTFEIDNGEKMSFAAPWVHPGPMGGFGGGQLSDSLINYLNSRHKGFFLHVPCTHKEDLADPDDISKVVEALDEPEKSSKASKLISKGYGNVKFYGRRIGGQKIVFMDCKDFDDYEIAIFNSIMDTDEVLLVDLHNHDFFNGPEAEMEYGTRRADELQGNFLDFLEELEDLELHNYSAGYEVVRDEEDAVAFVEEVDGQRTLLFGADSNGTTQSLKDLREEMEEEFDCSLLFSTDTHSSIHELAKVEEQDPEIFRQAISGAVEDLSPASAGLVSRKTDVIEFLKMNYQGLVFSINILIRLLPIALTLLYIMLWIWLF